MPDPKDKKEEKETRSSGMRKGSGQGGRGDDVLQKKARELTDDFAKDPFIEKDSAAAEILSLRDTLKNMVASESGEIKDAAQQLLNQTEQLISNAKKFGKVSVVAASTQQITQQVNALAKQVGTIESTLGGYKIKYVQAYQKSLESFEQRWMVRYPGTIFTPVRDAQKEEKEKLKNVHNWDDYMNAFLGDKVEKGKEKESLAKAISGLMLKQQNKEFSLEEADKLASSILKSEAFQKTFGKNGKLVESYLKNRNISQAILQMNEQMLDKDDVQKLKKEQDIKYKEFNEFLSMHKALKLGYEVMSKNDADNGTNLVQKMIDEYHEAKKTGNEITEATLMTKLLKAADPVMRAAVEKKPLPIGAEPTELVLTRKPEGE